MKNFLIYGYVRSYFLVIISWVIISIKFGNISTTQILISNLFIFIAYILYLVKFIRFKKMKIRFCPKPNCDSI